MEGAGVGSFHNRCRLCISEARLSLNLFETEAIRLSLINKIRIYLTIHVSLHDGLPQQICYECLSRIELFHSYKQSCLESQHTLKHWNLFCDGGELKEDDVLNVNVTSNVVEDKDVNRQAMEAETQSSSSGDQLPKQKGFMNSPNSTYSQSCRGSPRISKHFERVGNSVGKREVQCEAVDRLARELRKDIASGTSVEHELAWMKTKSRKSSPMSVHCVSCNSKEAPAENCSPLSQQNSKIFVHRSKTQRDVHENCTGLDIQIQSAHSVSSLMQSPPKPDTGPVLTFLDSALEQFESEVECEVIDIPAGELRNNAPINTAKQRNSSPVSVHCVPSSCKEACTQNHTPLSQHSSETSVQDQRMHMDAPGSQSGVDIPIKRSSDKLSLIQTPVKVYSVPLTFPDSTSKRSEGEGDSVEGSEVECELAATSELRGNFSCTVAKRESAKMGPKGINKSPLSMRSVLCIGKKVPRQNCTLPSWHNVKTSVQDQRMEPNATGTHSVLDMPTERSSPVCLLTRSPLKAATGTVLTFPDSTSKEYEGEGNSVVESEIQSKAIETARDTEVSFSSTTVKREACSHTPLCEQNSKTSAPNKKVQACVTGMDIPKRRPSIMSPLICDTHSLVTFPDTVVKECSTDYYCHNDIENLEITTWLTEQERNVIASENVAVSSQRQNESIHTNLRTDHERQKYQSVHALLKVLESDEDSNSFESDIENTRVRKMLAHTMCRPPTPGPRGRRRNGSTERVIKDPVTAGVKVENLTENKKGTTLHVRSKVKRATAVASQAKKPRRPYSQKQKNQSNQYRLVKSVMDEATGKVRYKCLKCSSMLSHKHYIKEHMKIHTGDKSFVCSMCNRAFRNNYMLKSHVVVHLPEKNFECEVCKHRFLGKERLKQHMRLHTATPFVCTVCGRTCSQKQSLKRHMRVHTGERPYKCDSCDAAFADRSTWINHRRIHTGERPFKCKECNKTFSRHVNLHAHKRTHSDVRLFGCQLCMSRFKTKAHLVKHLSCIHKDLMKSVVNFMKEEQHLE